MTKYTSETYELFASDKKGAAISMSGGGNLDTARKSFRRLRADSEIVSIRVEKHIYNLGGGPNHVRIRICDWERGLAS